jgi:hypothetical protein
VAPALLQLSPPPLQLLAGAVVLGAAWACPTGRYSEVRDNLHVKEVIVGDSERRHRYVVCLNPADETLMRLSSASGLSIAALYPDSSAMSIPNRHRSPNQCVVVFVG